MTRHTTVEAGAGINPACTFFIRKTCTAYLHGLRFGIPRGNSGTFAGRRKSWWWVDRWKSSGPLPAALPDPVV